MLLLLCAVGAAPAPRPKLEETHYHTPQRHELFGSTPSSYEHWLYLAEKMGDAIKERVADPKTGDIDSAMLQDWMGGKCSNIGDFQIATRNPDWQCGQADNHNFPTKDHPEYVAYTPDDPVIDALSRATGLTKQEAASIPLSQEPGLALGKWCGMPAPPDESSRYWDPIHQEYHTIPVSGWWKTCAQPYAGYLNVLTCNGTDDTSYAVMGVVGFNSNVCYPSHSHLATEVYWQVDGTGTWATWFNCSKKDEGLGTCKHNYEYGQAGQQHDHHPFLPHEMSTPDDDFMFLYYFWGKPDKEAANNYSSVAGSWRETDVNSVDFASDVELVVEAYKGDPDDWIRGSDTEVPVKLKGSGSCAFPTFAKSYLEKYHKGNPDVTHTCPVVVKAPVVKAPTGRGQGHLGLTYMTMQANRSVSS